jgi:hypothetical protein
MTIVHFDVDEATKAKKQELLKKLQELSEKSLGKIPELDDPDQEQQRWIDRKMKAPGSASAWKRWYEK